jgi:N utilization substance protein B
MDSRNIMNTSPTAPRSQSRSAARLAAVQALYQREMEATSLPRLLKEFHDHRIGREIEDAQYAEAEIAFFDDVVLGTEKYHEDIVERLTLRLSEGWTLQRLDKTLVQILRAGVYELLHRKEIPTPTVINEYVDVAHAFFDEKDAKFVNGILDAIAKDIRGAGTGGLPQ